MKRQNKPILILVIAIIMATWIYADSGVIDSQNEINAIKQQTLINGRQTYPHGFHTNKRLQNQLSIQNSAVVDNVGGDGVRYQIKNPLKDDPAAPSKKRVAQAGFSFSNMAKQLQKKPKKTQSSRGFSFSQMASKLKTDT